MGLISNGKLEHNYPATLKWEIVAIYITNLADYLYGSYMLHQL